MLIPEEKIDAIFQLMKKDLIKPENRILILIYLNCDSICATKIIGTLLKQNYIQYSLKPIISLENLYQIIKEDLTEEIVSLLLINCGGQIDIIHDLNIQKDITIYICDSHLPFHENNIKDEEKVNIFIFYLLLFRYYYLIVIYLLLLFNHHNLLKKYQILHQFLITIV